MPYYPTLAEDVARAKEILEKGRSTIEADTIVHGRDRALQEQILHVASGTIYGADIYAAYKLLESFVIEIERLQKLVYIGEHHFPDLTWQARCAVLENTLRRINGQCTCRRPGCGHPASEHDGHGGCKLCQRLNCWT